MNREAFNNLVERRISLTKVTLVKKGQEYSSETDVFHNFKSATGLSFHNTPEKVGWEFMVKHLQSIKDIMDIVDNEGRLPSVEMIEEKFGDAINYLILIEGILKSKLTDK